MRKRLFASILSIVLIAASVNVPAITVYADEGNKAADTTAEVAVPENTEESVLLTEKVEESVPELSAEEENTQEMQTPPDASAENIIVDKSESDTSVEQGQEVNEEVQPEEGALVETAENSEEETYQIIFNANGGSFDDGSTEMTVSVEEGSALADVPTAPTYDGYAFTGWFVDSDATEEIEPEEYISEGDIVLYAGWEEMLGTQSEGDSEWLENFSYTSDDTTVTLTRFTGTGITEVTIPGEAIIDGKTYSVNINSDGGSFFSNNASSLKSVTIKDTVYGVGRLQMLFWGCTNLTNLDLSGLDTSRVTDTDRMFMNCQNLTELDLSGFNTENVGDMTGMFWECKSLTSLTFGDTFITSKVQKMDRMFMDCSSLTSLDLSGYDMTKVTSANNMYFGCSSLKMINTPLNLGITLSINNWYDDNDEIVTELPKNSATSVCLTKEKKNISWQNDFTYTKDDFNKSITLTGYNKSGTTTLTIPGEAIMNGEEYKVYISTSYYSYNSTPFWGNSADSLKTIHIEETVYGTESLAYLFKDCAHLETLDIRGLNTDNVTNMEYMFSGCNDLTDLDISMFNTGNVTNMTDMFSGCCNLPSLDVSGFDTGNVVCMNGMFHGCCSLTGLDVSNFDTGNVTGMSMLFLACENLTDLDLSSFNTSKVKNMDCMFEGCTQLTGLALGNFETGNVTSMSYMFDRCSSLTSLDLSSFDMTGVSSAIDFFTGCDSLTEINTPRNVGISIALPSWDTWYDENNGIVSALPVGIKTSLHFVTTQKVTNTTWQDDFEYDLDDTNKTITLTEYKKFGTTEIIIPGKAVIDGEVYDVYITDVSDSHGSGQNTFWKRNYESLKSIKFGNVVHGIDSLSFLFSACSSLETLDLGGLDTGKVTDMSGMFYGCSKLKTLDISSLDTRNVTNMWCMFTSCTNLTDLDLSGLDTSNVTDMGVMFGYCRNLTSMNISSLDTRSVTDMGSMFAYCSKLTSLDLSSFDTQNVNYMPAMFDGCQNLTALDLSSFDTSKVTNMARMFCGCQNLTGLNLSGFDTGNVTEMYSMFSGCSKLTSLDLSSFNTGKTEKMREMFCNCRSLTRLNLSSFDLSEETAATDFFSGCSSLIEIDTPKNVYDQISLPSGKKWYDADNHIIAELPQNSSESVYLTTTKKEKDTTWQDDFTFTQDDSNCAITLTGYNQSGANELTIPGKAVIHGKQYKVYITTNDEAANWTSFWGESQLSLTSITFENTVYGIGSLQNLFNYCIHLTSLNLSGLDTGNVTNMSAMFIDCSSLTKLDVSGFDTSNVTGMISTFCGCSSLTSLDLSSFDTANVTIMRSMFFRCSELTNVNLSSFDTTNVIYAENMFKSCGNLTSLDLRSFDMGNVEAADDFLTDCSSLKEIYVPKFVRVTIPLPAGQTWYDESNEIVTDQIIPENLSTSICLTTEEKDMMVTVIGAPAYTGKAVKPSEIRVYDHSTLLVEGTDYTVTYKNNINVYTLTEKDEGFNLKKAPTITVKGKGSYTKSDTAYFTIGPKNLSDEDIVTADVIAPVKATGKAITPSVTITYGKTKLSNKKDYSLEYIDVHGYTVSSLSEPGTYTIRIHGKGNYTGYRDVSFTIAKASQTLVSKLTVKLPGGTKYNYTGKQITPAVTVMNGKAPIAADTGAFKITYGENTLPGTGTVTITGNASAGYCGTKTVTFSITGTAINKVKIDGSLSPIEYNGTEQEPAVSLYIPATKTVGRINLIKDVDYTISYQKNINAGTAIILITGQGGYTGTMKKTFKITPYNVQTDAKLSAENRKISVEVENAGAVPYAKGGAKPNVIVKFDDTKLTEGTDYTVSYANNKTVTASKKSTATVTFKGNFSGRRSEPFTIKQQDISKLQKYITAADMTTRAWKQKTVSVYDLDGKKLTAKTDYNITGYVFKNETTIGNHTYKAGDSIPDTEILDPGTEVIINIEGVNGYNNCASCTYRVTSALISQVLVAKPAVQTYTGEPIEWKPTLYADKNAQKAGKALEEGKDYEIVRYTNNEKKGTAKVVIRGINGYGGEKTITFTIGQKNIIWWFRNTITNLTN